MHSSNLELQLPVLMPLLNRILCGDFDESTRKIKRQRQSFGTESKMACRS